MAKDQKNQRKTLIINPTLQRRLIQDVSKVPIMALIIGALVVSVNFWLVSRMAQASEVELPGLYGLVVSLTGLVFIISCCFILHSALRISNCIAGPLYRLRKAMEQVLSGDTDYTLQIREGDYLEEVMDIFNRLVTHFKSHQKNVSNLETDDVPMVSKNHKDECACADESRSFYQEEPDTHSVENK